MAGKKHPKKLGKPFFTRYVFLRNLLENYPVLPPKMKLEKIREL